MAEAQPLNAKETLPVPPGFSFRRTVLSHGWCGLVPFALDPETWRLHRVLDLGGRVVEVTLSEGQGMVRIETAAKVSSRGRRELRRQVSRILGLDEDLNPFYAAAAADRRFAWIPRSGAGRLLRSPSVFEDLVKLLCTTNCSWSQTSTMIRRLVRALGEPASHRHGPTAQKDRQDSKGFMPESAGPSSSRDEALSRAFPSPQTMACAPLRFYRDEVRAGYRAESLRGLAGCVASGELDVEAWDRSELPTLELKKRIMTVRGAGPYTAENLLKLLGRHEGLALDSWCRSKFARLHARGRPVSDRRIARFYSPFAEYQGLALWCDLTHDWLDTSSEGAQ